MHMMELLPKVPCSSGCDVALHHAQTFVWFVCQVALKNTQLLGDNKPK